ncbi:hypothetical protein FRC07_004378 [Ceratobasidium sp. 392]|nr:hypothetical protein FRC07_004378 [Ceratobasidium sp. 392]
MNMADQTQDTHERTPEHVKNAVTPAASVEDHRSILGELLKGSFNPPYWMQGIPQKEAQKVVPACIEALVSEISRRFNVNVYACAAWNDGNDEMATTQMVQLVDQPSDDQAFHMEAVRHHFVNFVCQLGGAAIHIKPEDAFPVPYPDFFMDGRPALPPKHPNWKQERQNLVDWFSHLHAWQGGEVEPDWRMIQKDINEAEYRFIDRLRLPAKHKPFFRPDQWNEDRTWVWSKHLRSSMDEHGCVDEAYIRTAFQFRAILDEKNEIFRYELTFRTKWQDESKVDYGMAALMYAERVAKEKASREESIRSYMALLFPDVTAERVAQASKLLPIMQALYKKLRVYESRNPPKAPLPSSASLATWPRPARHVIREPKRIVENYLQYSYPNEFRTLKDPNLHTWSVYELYRWILSNPFLDSTSSLQLSGPDGIFVAFVALLQYLINVDEVRPKEGETEAQMLEEGRAVYSTQQISLLQLCVSKLLSFIESALLLLPDTRRVCETDLRLRHEQWVPSGWYHLDPEGHSTHLEAKHLQPDNYPLDNVFYGLFEDHWTTVVDDNTIDSSDDTTDYSLEVKSEADVDMPPQAKKNLLGALSGIVSSLMHQIAN